MNDIKLIKLKARTEIIFSEDKVYDDLIYINRIDKYTDKKTHVLIIKKDMKDFIDGFLKKGWEIDNSGTYP